jgi:predicted ABC-type ATPase
LRRLDLIVGPNGAGKTTFVEDILSIQLPPGVPFVNADKIARQRWPDDPDAHAYDAAGIAESTRAKLIAGGTSFIAETVFSHPSKVELVQLAKQNGYTVILQVLLIGEDLAVRRVAYRAAAGGHDVPEEKIRERYGRLWNNVAASVPLADAVIVYDNSQHRGPLIVAEFHCGMVARPLAWPEWTPEPLRALH